MIVDELVEVKWASRNIVWYESKNYLYTGIGTSFKVHIGDLQKGTQIKIKVQCDNIDCFEIYEMPYQTYLKCKAKSNHTEDYCKGCQITSEERRKKELFGIIKKEFSECNYELLSEEYKDAKQYLFYICKKHREKGIQKITWDNFHNGGCGCKYCGNENMKEKQSFSIDFVKGEFEKKDCILIEEEYINSRTKMRFICLKHSSEIQYTTFTDFSRHCVCEYCEIENKSRENNCNWKGGISPINSFLRSKLTQWKKDSMKTSNYKCIISGERFDVIHHTYPFNKIVEEVFIETKIPIREKIKDYTTEELNMLSEKCVEIHFRYPLGVCLTNEIHEEFHNQYGYKDNTPQQFEEFKLNYKNNSNQIKY